MTPASSVLLLTTLTGFGFGLIAWLGALAGLGFLPHAPLFIPIAVVIGLGFANAGLVASIVHLGHPERAWRATRIVGVLAAVLALVTVFCTAMIYASLKPIRQWHNPHTAPDYLIYAVIFRRRTARRAVVDLVRRGRAAGDCRTRRSPRGLRG